LVALLAEWRRRGERSNDEEGDAERPNKSSQE
jgi:hypothetical protein